LFHRNTGLYPARLTDLTLYGAPPVGVDAQGRVKPLSAARFTGPYLTTPNGGLPLNTITGGNQQGRDWLYDTCGEECGLVRPAAGPAVDGSNFRDW
jgi:hypothetical protein